jgi:hypothetical protein
VSGVVLRLAAEAALIVAVAVIAGVASFRPSVVVTLMAAAFVIVALSEWLVARARFVPPAAAFISHGEPAPYVEAPVPGWGGEPGEDTEPEALTVIASAEELEEAAAEVPERPDPWEAGLVAHGMDPEPELAERGGIFRRRRR